MFPLERNLFGHPFVCHLFARSSTGTWMEKRIELGRFIQETKIVLVIVRGILK